MALHHFTIEPSYVAYYPYVLELELLDELLDDEELEELLLEELLDDDDGYCGLPVTLMVIGAIILSPSGTDRARLLR